MCKCIRRTGNISRLATRAFPQRPFAVQSPGQSLPALFQRQRRRSCTTRLSETPACCRSHKARGQPRAIGTVGWCGVKRRGEIVAQNFRRRRRRRRHNDGCRCLFCDLLGSSRGFEHASRSGSRLLAKRNESHTTPISYVYVGAATIAPIPPAHSSRDLHPRLRKAGYHQPMPCHGATIYY